MCLLAGTFCFVFWEDSKGGWRPSFGRGIQRGRRALRPEESKETGGFVAEDPMGTASPWHTALHEVRQRRTSESDCLQSPSEAIKRRSRLMAGNARYSVLYLCGGDRRRMPAGRAADKLPAARMQIAFQQRRAHARTITAAEVYRSPSRRLRSIGFTPCENLCYNGHNHT